MRERESRISSGVTPRHTLTHSLTLYKIISFTYNSILIGFLTTGYTIVKNVPSDITSINQQASTNCSPSDVSNLITPNALSHDFGGKIVILFKEPLIDTGHLFLIISIM